MNKDFTWFKILKKGVLFVAPLYLLWFLYIESMPLYYNRPTNTRWYFIKESLKGTYPLPDANKIFLGESRVNAGIDFTKIPGAYSFASGGATPIEMFYILKKYLKNNKSPDTVFVSFSPRFLSETFAFWHFAVRNNLFDFSEMNEILKEKQAEDTVLACLPFCNFILYKADYLSYYQSDVLYSNVFGNLSKNKAMIDSMLKMRGGRYHRGLKDSCSDLNYETKYARFTPSPLLDAYFNKILALCSQNNCKTIFFSMPVNQSSYKNLKAEFIAGYADYMRQKQKQFPNCIISDSLYSYPDKFFGDESHLNSKGKEIFTARFLRKYKKSE